MLVRPQPQVRAAGILIAVSAGNSGSSCSSVNTPAAIYGSSFTVGATDNSDVIASLSGTSMAGPHVAGMTGLLVSAAPCLAGDVDSLEQHMIDSALPRTTTQTCGGVPGSDVPNSTYGYGALRSQLPNASCSGLITLSTPEPWVPGDAAQLVVSGLNPGEKIFFVSNKSGPGHGICPTIFGGLCTDLRAPFRVLGSAIANNSGVAVKTIRGPNTTENAFFQAFAPRGINTVSTNLLVVRPATP